MTWIHFLKHRTWFLHQTTPLKLHRSNLISLFLVILKYTDCHISRKTCNQFYLVVVWYSGPCAAEEFLKHKHAYVKPAFLKQKSKPTETTAWIKLKIDVAQAFNCFISWFIIDPDLFLYQPKSTFLNYVEQIKQNNIPPTVALSSFVCLPWKAEKKGDLNFYLSTNWQLHKLIETRKRWKYSRFFFSV